MPQHPKQHQAPRKPVTKLREEVLKDEIILVGTARAKVMDGKSLIAAEEYYHAILECLVGHQVWDILDALTAVEGELHARRNTSRQPSNTDETPTLKI